MATKRVLPCGAPTFAFGPIAPGTAHAQAHPEKLIKIAAPGGAGWPTDNLAPIVVAPGDRAMNLSRRRFLHLLAGAAATSGVSRVARAQTYPSRPVRWIIGAPLVARLMSSPA